MTLTDFVEKYNLGSEIVKIPFRTDKIGDEQWDGTASHFAYRTYVKYGNRFGKKIQGQYSQGAAIKGKPTIEDVLNALSLDTIDIGSFEQFCAAYGYDEDSRKAYKIYEECLLEYKQLIELLGSEGLDELHHGDIL